MTTVPGPPLHPALEPFAFLIGSWRGTGDGSFPTIDSFQYREEITFVHVGKPFLAYSQKTSHAESGLPLHAESGYWRPQPDGALEVVLAHPTGIMESFTGSFTSSPSGGVIDLVCEAVGRTATAVEVTETTRRFVVDGDALSYDMAMAAVGVPLTHHLHAELTRS